MPVTVADIITCLDGIAPFSVAESWDNVGLLVGDQNRSVTSILVALDPTSQLLDEAIGLGADTVITHHPALFKPLLSINTADPTGIFLEKALSARLTVVACHTNLDSAEHGVNDALAERLGLIDLVPLIPADHATSEGVGMGRIGRFAKPITGSEFITRVLEVLGLPSCDTAGPLPQLVQTVALCGGSGSDLAEQALRRGADLYLSAEIKHHTARWAEACGFCVIDGTHFATEKPVVERLARNLRDAFRQRGWQVTVHETTTETHPFVRMQKTIQDNH